VDSKPEMFFRRTAGLDHPKVPRPVHLFSILSPLTESSLSSIHFKRILSKATAEKWVQLWLAREKVRRNTWY